MASNLRVDSIVPATGANVSIGTATGGVNIPGVLTYEDVTNVDSVGVITARSGIDAASNLLLKTGGTERLRINSNGFVGINTSSPLAPLHTYEATNNTIARLESGDATCRLQLKDNTGETFVAATGDNLIFANTSSITERLRIGSAGQLGIAGANYGTSGQVLTSQGNSSAPTWATPSSGLAMADLWRLTTTYTIPTNSTTIFSTADWERPDTGNDGFGQLGTGMSVNSSDHAAGVWTFPSTGFYLVTYNGIVYNGSNDPYEVLVRIEFTENGGSNWGLQTRAFGGGERGNYNPITGQAIVDVTSTSDVKMRLRVYSANSSSTLQGNTGENRNYVSFIRLGDT